MEQGIRPIGELLTDRGECQYLQPEGHSGELLSVTRMAGGGCVSGWSPVQQFLRNFARKIAEKVVPTFAIT